MTIVEWVIVLLVGGFVITFMHELTYRCKSTHPRWGRCKLKPYHLSRHIDTTGRHRW